jgi:hypothetical protein
LFFFPSLFSFPSFEPVSAFIALYTPDVYYINELEYAFAYGLLSEKMFGAEALFDVLVCFSSISFLFLFVHR